jgi:hypothetical protein
VNILDILSAAQTLNDLAKSLRDKQLSREFDRIDAAVVPKHEALPRVCELITGCQHRHAATLVLLGNDWDSFMMNGIVQRPAGARSAAGYAAVCPGRHEIRTSLGAGVSLILFPAEFAVYRRSGGTWTQATGEDVASVVVEARRGQLVLLDYLTWIAAPQAVHMEVGFPPASVRVKQIALEVRYLVERLEHGIVPATIVEIAISMGQRLLGLPLLSLDEFRGPLIAAVERCAAARDPRRVWSLLTFGLTLLPKEPRLSVLMGEFLCAEGYVDLAQSHIEAALLRVGLDATYRARAEAAAAQKSNGATQSGLVVSSSMPAPTWQSWKPSLGTRR